MSEILISIASSILATLIYSRLNLNTMQWNNQAYTLLLRNSKSNASIYTLVVILSIVIGVLIDFLHVFRFDYVYFLQKQLSLFIENESFAALASTVLIYIIVIIIVSVYFKLFDKALVLNKTCKSMTDITLLTSLWVLMVATHIGYTISLWRISSVTFPIFIAFSIVQLYFLVMFIYVRKRQICLDNISYKVLNLHNGKVYHSRIDRIKFSDDKAIIITDDNLVSIASFELNIIDRSLLTSSKYKRIEENIINIKKSVRK